MPVQIEIRRDTAANWSSTNPILADGEFGYEKNTGRLKLGDGVTTWNGLPYFSGGVPVFINSVDEEGPEGPPGPPNPPNPSNVVDLTSQLEFYYDGTRWLSRQLFYCGAYGITAAFSATTNIRGSVVSPEDVTYDKWLLNFQCEFMVNSGGTALDGSNNWSLQLKKDGTGGGASIGSAISINSGASGVWRTAAPVALNALMGTTFGELVVTCTKTGTPGTLFPMWMATYRLVLP